MNGFYLVKGVIGLSLQNVGLGGWVSGCKIEVSNLGPLADRLNCLTLNPKPQNPKALKP